MADELLIAKCRLIKENGDLSPFSDVVASGGVITSIRRHNEKQRPSGSVLNCHGRLLIPGLINTHCHSPMTLFRGMADDLPLMEWLNEHIFPAEARLVNPEMAYICGRLAGLEMLMAGITTVADSYFHASDAARGLVEAGMRVISAQGIIDFPAPGVPDPGKNIKAAADFLADFDCGELARPAIFCHSPYTCSGKTLCEAKKLARDAGCLFFIHLAETRAEVAIINKEHGTSPARYLAGLGLLDSDTVLVHCVHLDDEEIGLIAAADAAISLCPRSNMKLASGIAPADRILAAGIRTGLGTDGPASNNLLDILLEMDMVAKSLKIFRHDPATIPATQAYAMATWMGAASLGLDQEIGRIKEGMRADLAVIASDNAGLTPQYHGHSLLAYSASGNDVNDVVVNGRVVVRDRVPLLIDRDETMRAVNRLARSARPGL